MNDLISRQAAIDEWKNDFKGYVNALNIPRDDYKGIMAYIDELPFAQPESETADTEFWKKRADEYSKICSELCFKLSEGHNCDSIQLGENGITFHLSAQQDRCKDCRFTFYEKPTDDEEGIIIEKVEVEE